MNTLLLLAALAAAPANPLCPVTGRPVANHRLYHHVWVLGHRYYVYDREAAHRLRACPDCYLNPDGTPRNSENQTQY